MGDFCSFQRPVGTWRARCKQPHQPWTGRRRPTKKKVKTPWSHPPDGGSSVLPLRGGRQPPFHTSRAPHPPPAQRVSPSRVFAQCNFSPVWLLNFFFFFFWGRILSSTSPSQLSAGRGHTRRGDPGRDARSAARSLPGFPALRGGPAPHRPTPRDTWSFYALWSCFVCLFHKPTGAQIPCVWLLWVPSPRSWALPRGGAAQPPGWCFPNSFPELPGDHRSARDPSCKRSPPRSDPFPLHPHSPRTSSPNPQPQQPASPEPNFASNNNKATNTVLFGGKFRRNPACQMHFTGQFHLLAPLADPKKII